MSEYIAMWHSIDTLTQSTVIIYFLILVNFWISRLWVHFVVFLGLFAVFFWAKIQYHYYDVGDVAWAWLVFNGGTAFLIWTLSQTVKNYSRIKK